MAIADANVRNAEVLSAMGMGRRAVGALRAGQCGVSRQPGAGERHRRQPRRRVEGGAHDPAIGHPGHGRLSRDPRPVDGRRASLQPRSHRRVRLRQSSSRSCTGGASSSHARAMLACRKLLSGPLRPARSAAAAGAGEQPRPRGRNGRHPWDARAWSSPTSSFELKAGQGLGIIGPSAAGKSTLARALMGLWPLARGERSPRWRGP